MLPSSYRDSLFIQFSRILINCGEKNNVEVGEKFQSQNLCNTEPYLLDNFASNSMYYRLDYRFWNDIDSVS